MEMVHLEPNSELLLFPNTSSAECRCIDHRSYKQNLLLSCYDWGYYLPTIAYDIDINTS